MYPHSPQLVLDSHLIQRPKPIFRPDILRGATAKSESTEVLRHALKHNFQRIRGRALHMRRDVRIPIQRHGNVRVP